MQDTNFNPREYDCIMDLSGNGKVTLMEHNKTGRQIVRKAISAEKRETYRQLLNIKHENIVSVLGLEESGPNYYTYEEHINGKTLAEALAEGVVPEETAVSWIKQLCAAVRVLHEQSPPIIHRDIKPSNIMVSDGGVIKLIDFDAAKNFSAEKNRDTELMGTPDYAAPEQYGFATSDCRTDIYAIGVIFHELLTGNKPNSGGISYNGRYKRVIEKCVEFKPKERYRNIRALERQLEICGRGFFSRWAWKIAAAAAAVLAIALLAFFMWDGAEYGEVVYSLLHDEYVQTLPIGLSDTGIDSDNPILRGTRYLVDAGEPTLTIVENPLGGNAIRVSNRRETYHALDLLSYEAGAMTSGGLYNITVTGSTENPTMALGASDEPWAHLTQVRVDADGTFTIDIDISPEILDAARGGAEQYFRRGFRIMSFHSLHDFTIYNITVTRLDVV